MWTHAVSAWYSAVSDGSYPSNRKLDLYRIEKTLLDVLASKQVNIYISLATSLIGAVFGLLLDRCIKGSRSPTLDTQSSAPVAVSMSQAVHVSVAAKANADDQLLMFFTGVILVVLGIVYMFFREELLYAGLLLVLFFVGTWAGVVVHSLYRGFFHGWMWFVYLLIMLGFGVAAMRVVGLAKAPMFAPRNFRFSFQARLIPNVRRRRRGGKSQRDRQKRGCTMLLS